MHNAENALVLFGWLASSELKKIVLQEQEDMVHRVTYFTIKLPYTLAVWHFDPSSAPHRYTNK